MHSHKNIKSSTFVQVKSLNNLLRCNMHITLCYLVLFSGTNCFDVLLIKNKKNKVMHKLKKFQAESSNAANSPPHNNTEKLDILSDYLFIWEHI